MFPPQAPPGGGMPPGPGQGEMSPLLMALGAGGPQQGGMGPVASQPGDLGPLLEMIEQAKSQGIPPQALLQMLSEGGGGMRPGMMPPRQGMQPGGGAPQLPPSMGQTY